MDKQRRRKIIKFTSLVAGTFVFDAAIPAVICTTVK